MSKIFHNPILPGFYPDPSICRVDEDYYLVTSTFEYFPGLPIFHSRDLVNWQQIGHVIDRPSQLDLDEIRNSGGLFAPTIRYHNGTFYVINTLVDGKSQSGNFIVTATNPAGPWSDPYWLENAPGIDPSLFFDDDGRCWYCGTELIEEGFYTGHTQVYVQELDLSSMQLIGERTFVWDGAVKGSVWTEAPHIYKVNGRYYLLTAEAGTAHHHAIVISRSDNITGPYEGNRGNPILTHRHLGLDYPIVGPGHGDWVQTQNGEWWMVLLAMRPYDGYYYNLGRETFLVPMRWEEDGWPIISPGTGRVEHTYPVPNLPEHPVPPHSARDDFDEPVLSYKWNFLRIPREGFWSLTARPGHLRLHCRPEKLSQQANPSFVGRRQQHINFTAKTAVEFTPQSSQECAGLIVTQNHNFHYRFVVTQNGSKPLICLIERANGREKLLVEKPFTAGKFYLKVQARGQNYSFYAASALGDAWQPIAENVDGRILSTPVAGGFVGAYIGMITSSNGQPSSNYADFDWFEYKGEDK